MFKASRKVYLNIRKYKFFFIAEYRKIFFNLINSKIFWNSVLYAIYEQTVIRTSSLRTHFTHNITYLNVK